MVRNLTDTEVAAFRGRLSEIAERLFAERGPEAVTMREIAREMGVSAMTPYRYFRDKDDILATVRTAAFNRFAEALEIAARIKGNPEERVQAVGSAYLDFAFGQRHAYKLMFELSQPDKQYPELERAQMRARRTMTDYVKALVAAGYLAGDPETLGQIFWAMVHGLVVLELAGKLHAKPDFATLHRTAMRLLMRGAQVGDQRERRRAQRATS